MLALHSLASIVALLASCNWAVATPAVDLSLIEQTSFIPAMYPKVSHYYASNGTELASIMATNSASAGDIADLEPLIDPQVVVAAFQTVAKITEIVCQTAGATACVVAGLVAVLGIYFSLFQMQGRGFSDQVFLLDYPPVPGCGGRCRLELEAPEGDWRSVGNATIDGVFHTLHYKRNGTYHGIRSIQYISEEKFTKRAQDNDGGVIVDYNWQSISEQAYDSFDSFSSEISSFADDIVDDMSEANSIQACADFEDSDGLLDGGLVSIGWNNQPFEFQDGQEQAMVDQCENI